MVPIYNVTTSINIIEININMTRVNTNNVYLTTNKFIQEIKTRYDRAEPSPSLRLNYDINMPKLGKNVKMDRMLERPTNVFPTVNSLVKKKGDDEIME
jgi:hypothetical protein